MERVRLLVVEYMEAATADAAVVGLDHPQHQRNSAGSIESVSALLQNLQTGLGGVGVIGTNSALGSRDMGLIHSDSIIYRSS